MSRLIPIIFILIPGFRIVAQNDLQERFSHAYALNEQRNYKQALAEFKAIIEEAPDYTMARVQTSWCYLITADIQEATRHADLALLMDPYYQASYSIKAYVAYANGDPDAEQFLKLAIWLSQDDSMLQYFILDYDNLIAAGVKPETFRALKTTTTNLFQARNRAFGPVITSIGKAQQLLGNNQGEAAHAEFQNAARLSNFPAEYGQFKALTLYFSAIMLANYQYWNESRPFFEEALKEFAKYPQINAYARTALLSRMANTYIAMYDDEKARSLLTPAISQALALPAEAASEKAMFLDALCKSETNLNKMGDLKTHAQMLNEVAKSLGYPFYYVTSLNYLGIAHQAVPLSADRLLAAQYFQEGIVAAQRAGLEDLEMDIKTNYANNKFSQQDYEGALQLNTEVANYLIRKKRFADAEMVYNNLGAMFYGMKNYKAAITYLRKSIEIVEKFRNEYTGEDKLNFMARGVSSQQFLVACLTGIGDWNGLFEAQNLDRGRTLSELINNDEVKRTISLQDFQKLLKPDEAAIIYSLMESGSVVINVITSTSSHAVQNTQSAIMLKLKEKYLDRFNGNGKKPGYRSVVHYEGVSEEQRRSQLSTQDMEDMVSITRDMMPKSYAPYLPIRTEFLRAYYDWLIGAVQDRLTGVKKLIIMPDGMLNFLPFETLVSPGGKYVVEQFDIRYVQSGQVKKLIEDRNYGQRSKELLAMGGAVYDEMNISASPLTNSTELVSLQNTAADNVLKNKSQRPIYASLGFGKLSYLQGTLEEVKSIAGLFPSADVYTGSQMTENFIKSLSASRGIKNYKIIHLATHGFALPQIPQLSGIAMCVPPNEYNGEDGYLTAPEIARLGMEADLAVLSACETGLGKIYGGEGVAGLTQSLLVGGANRAIVSLWPVNDLGTMHFMKGFYSLVKEKGKSYDEAINIMKRKFIGGEFGEELKSPEMWAAFVHYGK